MRSIAISTGSFSNLATKRRPGRTASEQVRSAGSDAPRGMETSAGGGPGQSTGSVARGAEGVHAALRGLEGSTGVVFAIGGSTWFLSEKFAQLGTKVEVLQANVDHLRQEFDTFRADSKKDVGDLKADVADLGKDVARLAGKKRGTESATGRESRTTDD